MTSEGASSLTAVRRSLIAIPTRLASPDAMTDDSGSVVGRPDDAGPEFAALLEKLNVDQDARKTSLEQRALAVITTSGALATLLFGLVTLSTRSADYQLPRQAGGPLAVALVLFVVAAVLAVLINVPVPYKNFVAARVRPEIWDNWYKGKNHALREITASRLDLLEKAQRINGIKAWLLVVGMFAEVLAVGAVAIAVGEVLRH